MERGLADALIVSGAGTGFAASLARVRRLRQACPESTILIGSGIRADNMGRYLRDADGVIVGTSLKAAGRIDRPVGRELVKDLRKKMTLRS